MNGTYRGDNAIGKILHDLSCENVEDMLDEVLKERVRYLKEGDGRFTMCEIMQAIKNEGIEEGIKIGQEKGIKIGQEKGIKIGQEKGKKEIIQQMIEEGLSIEMISRCCRIPEKDVLMYR